MTCSVHTQLLMAPKNTTQVRNAQKNLRRRNGQTDSLLLLQLYANDFPDCRFYPHLTSPHLTSPPGSW